MAVYTPGKRKIRVDREYAFALMNRLRPKYTASDVLVTVDSLAKQPAAASSVVAGVVPYYDSDPISIGCATAIAYFAIFMVQRLRLADHVGLVFPAQLLSLLGPVPVLNALAVGYSRGGWHAVTAYLVGRGVAWMVSYLLQFERTEMDDGSEGWATQSERLLLTSFLWHARRAKVSTSLDVGRMERHLSAVAFEEYRQEFPAAAELSSRPELIEKMIRDPAKYVAASVDEHDWTEDERRVVEEFRRAWEQPSKGTEPDQPA